MSDNENKNKRSRVDETKIEFLDTTAHVLASEYAITRLPELESYYQSVTASLLPTPKNKESLFQSKGGKCSNRHLRRRTGSYKPRRRHRFPTGNFETNDDECKEKDVKSRRWRRNPKRLMEIHNLWRKKILIEKTSVHWLVSHYWQSKRFHMMKLFGWVIPMIHTNRGTKTALNAECTLQDTSYCAQPFELISDGESLKNLLQCIMPGVVISKDRMWEGVMYRPNGYPALPIGPARVLSFEEEGKVRVWIMTHPLLYEDLFNILSSCTKDNDDITGPSTVDGGVGLLSLRGPKSTTVLSQTLSPSTDIIQLEKSVHHTKVIPTSLTIPTNPNTTIDAILIKIKNSNPTCSGWDIILPPPSSFSNLPVVFLALNHSSAYAIGLVEQTRILTDALIPCFPRDYPDCPYGEAYYDTNATDSSRLKQVMDAEEWKWGQKCSDVIKKGNDIEINKSFFDWNKLIQNDTFCDSSNTKENNDTTEKSQKVIVLRGETYGAPFLHLFQYNDKPNSPSPTQQVNKRKRPRRPVSNPHSPKLRPIPNKQQLLSQVQSMITSISPNVILRCVIHIETDGIIKVGDVVHEYNQTFKLGAIVSSGFSLGNGRYSGTGFVSAASFLQAMRNGFEEKDNKSLVWICGRGRRELRVWVNRDGCKPRLATLFLLL